MYQLANLLNTSSAINQSEKEKSDCDAGYCSNGSSVSSPGVTKTSTTSFSPISSSCKDENIFGEAAKDLLTDFQSHSGTTIASVLSTASCKQRKTSITDSLSKINSAQRNDSANPIRKLIFPPSSSKEFDVEKMRVQFDPSQLGSSSSYFRTIESDLNNSDELTISATSQNSDKFSQLPYGDLELFESITSCENSLDGLTAFADQSGVMNAENNLEQKQDKSKLFNLEDLGLMDTSLLIIPSDSNSKETPEFNLSLDSDIAESSPAKDIDVSEISPSPCVDDVSETKEFVSRIGDSNRANGLGNTLVSQVDPAFPTEDEVWRSYLENPLTAATTAMMSIHGDEDSANALGLLYEYYKVPREKRILSYQMDNVETSLRQTAHDNIEVAPTSDNVILVSGTLQRPRTMPVTSSDSTLHDVISGETECPGAASLGTVNVHLPEISSDCLHIDSRKQRLPSDGCYTDSKDFATQVMSFTTCSHGAHDVTTRHKKEMTSSSLSSSNQPEMNQFALQLPVSHGLHQQLVSTSPIHLPNFTPTEGDSLPHEYSGESFEYMMEAPKSLKQKEGEPTMSYINKGQFYCISLRCNPQFSRSGRVTSVVQIVFGDSKPEEEQQRHWKYWHARQHTAKQRIIDIADYKESCMISNIDEIAHNAIAFSWDVNDLAKIFISCNCLSTDFSAQKGIKGLPLLLQIDTYLDNRRSGIPYHRGVCQLKVFCDKGAERKIRDEERKALRKKQKGHKGSSLNQSQIPPSPVDIKPIIRSPNGSPTPQSVSTVPGQNGQPQKKLDIVHLMPTSDRRPATYFVPDIYGATRSHVSISPPAARLQAESTFTSGSLTPTSAADVEQVFLSAQVDCFDSLQSPSKRSQSLMSSEEGEFPPAKIPKLWESESKKVLLYIRKETDEAYDGLLLKEPTLNGLKEALNEKYNLPVEKITKLLKKSRKGILVNLDDNIICHYSNEDTFIIEIASENCNDDVSYKVTLSVV